jgi:hypothetical protein
MNKITIIAKTITEYGDEDEFGPYNTIQDLVMVQYTIHKHLGNHISVNYSDGEGRDGEGRDGKYVLTGIDNNDDFKVKLNSIFESFNDVPYKYNYTYGFLKNHHLIFTIKN